MNETLQILSSCVLAGNKAVKNDSLFFSTEETMLQPFLLQLYKHLQIEYPKFYKMDNLSKLGWLASEILLKDEVIVKQFKAEEIGLVLLNANASLDADIRYFQTIDMASPALFVYTLPNILIGEICIRNGFKGENACFVFEEFNAAFIKDYAEGLFAANNIKLCMCGWVDVLAEEYKATLFLVSNESNETSVAFTENNMSDIFNKVV